MENDNNIIINDDLITRYLSGEAKPEEAVALQDWLKDHANSNYFEEARSTWHAAFPAKRPRSVNIEMAWSKLKHEINPSVFKKPQRSLRPRTIHYSIAASVVFVIAVGLAFYLRDGRKVREILVSTQNTTRQIHFPDNSKIALYHNSTISYPKSFDGKSREVHLATGEAFFQITPDNQKPFIVHTDVGDIKVVGTAFNVVVADGRLKVSVNEGKVMMYSANDTVMLKAGFSGEVKSGNQSIRVKDTINANEWGYATNQFVFKDTPLQEVISSIEKAHPCTIKLINTNINNCRLTATFEKVSVENMLALISETLNLSVTRDGKMFILEGEGCP